MLKKLALTFGIIFVAIGILGFIPAFTPDDKLLGIFPVNTLANFIHLASGLVALAASSTSAQASRLWFQVFGSVYAVVTLVGFVQGDTVLGLIPANFIYNMLHLIIAVTTLYIGFGLRDNDAPHTRSDI